jgi:hypothetical protein
VPPCRLGLAQLCHRDTCAPPDRGLLAGTVPATKGGRTPRRLKAAPQTAADKYADNAYRVTPWVYLQSYTDGGSNPASFCVMTDTVD